MISAKYVHATMIMKRFRFVQSLNTTVYTISGRMCISCPRVGRRLRSPHSLDSQNMRERIPEPRRSQRVAEEIHAAIHNDKQKLKISKPMQGGTTTAFTKTHRIYKHCRRTITTQKSQ
jgi:hypothetical protein